LNIIEKKAKELYEKEGWEVINKGAPDFLLIKRDKHRKIISVKFAEIKTIDTKKKYEDKLRYSQKIWKEALLFINADYNLFKLNINTEDKTKLEILCIVCGKYFIHTKRGKKPIYCKKCYEEVHKKQMRHNKDKYRKLGTTTLREFKYDDFWKEYDIIKKEKIKLKLEQRRCPVCESIDIRYDKDNENIYCFSCGFILEGKCEYIIDLQNPDKKIGNGNSFPEQNDWNR
jgi:ribosomal protein S27E